MSRNSAWLTPGSPAARLAEASTGMNKTRTRGVFTSPVGPIWGHVTGGRTRPGGASCPNPRQHRSGPGPRASTAMPRPSPTPPPANACPHPAARSRDQSSRPTPGRAPSWRWTPPGLSTTAGRPAARALLPRPCRTTQTGNPEAAFIVTRSTEHPPSRGLPPRHRDGRRRRRRHDRIGPPTSSARREITIKRRPKGRTGSELDTVCAVAGNHGQCDTALSRSGHPRY